MTPVPVRLTTDLPLENATGYRQWYVKDEVVMCTPELVAEIIKRKAGVVLVEHDAAEG